MGLNGDTLLRVTWKDSGGTKLADATTAAGLEKTLAAIKVDGGEVLGIRKLEEPKS